MYKRLDPLNHDVTDEFVRGLRSFFYFAQKDEKSEAILCPCSRCKNKKRRDANTVRHHLYAKGFTDNYYLWTSHGETVAGEGSTSAALPEAGSKRYLEMLAVAKGPLYEGCKEGLSPLSMIIELWDIKTTYDLSEDCVEAMLELMNEYLPQGHKAPKSLYEAEILIKLFGMPPN
ncbi:unnamed protein product [Microthlaspi erraticum]|uniref:Transposase-associated domain-containing protein n=1 Tax=Microthlaspi erraticum TaxID=1685480 RepID=A0A6D2IBH6_9BRAS|nr:unnamed protein product [Microthlaspi erraticum]